MRFGSCLTLLALFSCTVFSQQNYELSPEDKALLSTHNEMKNTVETGPVPLGTEDYKLSQADRDLMLRAQKKLLDITNGKIPEVARGLENIKQDSSEQAKKYHAEAQDIEKRTKYGISRDQFKALEIIAGEGHEDIISQMQQAHQEAAKEELTEDGEKVQYFISYAMPARIIDEILITASKNANAEVLVRGMMEGMENIGQMIRFVDAINLRLQKQGKIDLFPNVQLAPIEFMKHDIARAPSIVLTENGEQIKATGLAGIDYLQKKLKQGINDAGVVSETYPIGEKLLFEQIEERVANVDWESKKQEAIDSYWKKYTFIDLQSQAASETYFIDPSITMTQDIPAYNGKMLAYAGQRVNPLELMPISLNMIIFDASNPSQTEWAIKQFEKSGGTAEMVATKLDVNRGWKQLNELTNQMGKQLYVLREDITRRFALKAVPSVVSTEGTLIKVDIIGRTDWESRDD